MTQEITEPDNKTKKPKTWVWLVVIVAIIIIVAGIWYLVYSMSLNQKDDQNKDTEREISTEEYNWSTMDQGPYHDRISYASAKSLTDWTSPGVTLAEHASVPDVIRKDDILYIYFVDVSEDGKPEQIGLIKSNGILDGGDQWADKQIINIDGLGNKVAVDPCPYLLEDGRIRLYYFDISKTKTEGVENNTIYSAISDDGMNFIEEEGHRFRYPAIFDPDVIKVGNTWRMYVGTDGQKVLSATSADGLTFTYEGVALDQGSIPEVFYEDGTYYLFTGGIEISTSTDGKNFTKTNSRFDSGGLTADPGVVKLKDDRTYFMVYKTNDSTLSPNN
ncbi:hypothetical protein ACFL14_00590 [Patescibacteria group bacterium]